MPKRANKKPLCANKPIELLQMKNADEAVAYPPPADEEGDDDNVPSSAKRQRTETDGVVALYAPPLEVEDENQNNNIRTSSLAEPTMKLSGHKGSVYCLAYDPQGEMLCSGSFDSTCLLWRGEYIIRYCNLVDIFLCIYHCIRQHQTKYSVIPHIHISASGNCENLNVLSGHKNAILDLCFTNDSEKIISASADYNLGVYDSTTGERIKRFMGHTGIVNAVDVCREG